jgi:hypothetical protein
MTVLGPFHVLTIPDAVRNLDDRLPQPNSLRRAGEETKVAVLAAAELLRSEGVAVSDRMGVYVGQQQIALDYCEQFVEASYREGPRLASPMLFAESVANNIATHLSLTLGLKGVAQTFIGTRAAGIQAIIAAREDLQSGAVDVGLVVIMGVAGRLTRDAYRAVFRPHARRRPPLEMEFLRGAAACLVRREAAGQPRIDAVGVRCFGRQESAQIRAVASRCSSRRPETRLLDSTFSLAREHSLRILRRAPVDEGFGEAFALDPFLRLLADSRRFPGPQGRAVVCLGEEGIVGLLSVGGAINQRV